MFVDTKGMPHYCMFVDTKGMPHYCMFVDTKGMPHYCMFVDTEERVCLIIACLLTQKKGYTSLLHVC